MDSQIHNYLEEPHLSEIECVVNDSDIEILSNISVGDNSCPNSNNQSLCSNEREDGIMNNPRIHRISDHISKDSSPTFEFVGLTNSPEDESSSIGNGFATSGGEQGISSGRTSKHQLSELKLSVASNGKAQCLSITPKLGEEDPLEERDTFSPVNIVRYLGGLQQDEVIDETSSSGIGELACHSHSFESSCQFGVDRSNTSLELQDNKAFERKRMKSATSSSTKEEKQRQNEEIVIMETSSISSETGSWESVFPQQETNHIEVKASCQSFLENERTCSGNEFCISMQTDIFDRSKNIINPSSSVTACFIDASSLLDEPEASILTIASLPAQMSSQEIIATSESNDPTGLGIGQFSIEKSRLLEQTHAFPTNSISSSSGDSLNNYSSNEENSNNLSDEEKLRKRKFSKKGTSRVEVQDQFVRENDQFSIFEEKTAGKPTIRQRAFEHDDQVNKHRREQERMQGTLLFRNSIHQYSGHLISPKMEFTDKNVANLGEPRPNWIDQQQCDSTTGPFLDASNCGETSSKYNFQAPSGSEISIPCILPDTPHNSIIQVNAVNQLMDNMGNAETVVSLNTDKIMKRSTRCDDSAPIVSGGASIKDFTPKQCESPPSHRKTDACPIISGGFIPLDSSMDETEKMQISVKEKMQNTSLALKSWVVDMSDCQSRRRKSTSSSSSTDNTAHTTDGSGSDQKNGGLGFYVPLLEATQNQKPNIDDKSSNYQPSGRLSRSYYDQFKKPAGFYIDLSESENSRAATPPPSASVHTPHINSTENTDSKKNIFSMFIDFGEKKIMKKRETLSLASRMTTSSNQKSSCSSIETVITQNASNNIGQENYGSTGEAAKTSLDMAKKLSYTFTENDAPVIKRLQRSLLKDGSKRHSWNNPEPKAANHQNREHKRSVSLVSEDKGMMHIIDKLPIISKTSSMSIDTSLSPFDDFSYSKSELSTYSNNSDSATSASVHSNGGEIEETGKKKRRREVHLNETFDKSSQGSLTDGVFSKDSSPVSTTDTDDLTFQQEEIMCIAAETAVGGGKSSSRDNFSRPSVMETIIETKENASPKKQSNKIVCNEDNKSHTMETLHATIQKQQQLLETVSEHVEASSIFVKLSDMDKPIVNKFELHSPDNLMSKSVGSHRHLSRLFQENNRPPPQSWNMSRSIGNNFMNITSSVENLKSLSRLFPHLSRQISSSLPGDVTFDVYNRSPHDNGDLGQSDYSGESSLASSISRSGMDESSISCRQPRKLGEDLLKMFLQEIGTDVVVEVNGRRIKAHKCILRSRCQYFAAMLAGGWVQSAGNVVSLPGYSYSSVHFALCHIYSGASHPPEGISLIELAALADLLGLEGLKEVTAHSLKLNYCHNFHKPCSGCIDGILQVLPVALNHALDDLYRKCLKWTCRYYIKVWLTRSFAQLPTDIFSRCRQMILAHMTTESVLETILDCDYLISQLAAFRWATAIENLVRDMLDAAYAYISDHFSSLIASDSFLSLGHDKSHNISRLETILLQTASSLVPDQACRSYQRITRLNAVLAAKVIKIPSMSVHTNNLINGRTAETLHEQEEEMEWNAEFIRLVSAILSAVEQCLIKQCARAMRVAAWQRMDLELRKKIQKLACLTEPLDLRRNKNMPKQISFNASGSRSQDLYQVKMAIQAHSKRVLGQDTQLYRATTHTQTNNIDSFSKNIQTNEKGVQANNESKEIAGKLSKPFSKPNVLQQTQIVYTPKSEKINAVGHRRTLSEDSCSSKRVASDFPSVSRLSDVRPRYLEPRKPRTGPLKSQTSSDIPHPKGKYISSTESSRTSSPATGNRNAIVRKIGTKSTNMSLDSLASPSKKTALIPKQKARRDMDISIDSLGDSMKSSLKTDKTISQESLIPCNKDNKISQSHSIINKENKQLVITTSNKTVRNKSLSCQTTSGSSPSSVTNKSGRLSSTTSSMNSPRDAFKHRSISVPAGATNNHLRKSFLTPKSREILARKSAATAKLNESSLSMDKIFQASLVCKSSSSSNIPTRRLQSTIMSQQRRSVETRPVSNTLAKPTQSSQLKCVQRNYTSSRVTNRRSLSSEKSEKMTSKKISHDSNKIEELVRGSERFGEEKIELVIKNPLHRKESKLERSSTFCKEVSDLPVNELQIIE